MTTSVQNNAYDIGCPVNWFAGKGMDDMNLSGLIGGFQYKHSDKFKIIAEKAKERLQFGKRKISKP